MAVLGIFPLLVLLLAGGNTGNDALSFLSTQAYWKSKSVEVSVEAMQKQLAQVPVGDISKHLASLSSAQYGEREAATQAILAMGEGVIPQLEPALTSPNAETSARAGAMIDQLRAESRTRSTRRLMAIRALGELKNRESLAVLRPLLESREPFEAAYAQAAVALIEGKPAVLPAPDPALRQADVNLMPVESSLIVQSVILGDNAKTIEQIVEQIVSSMAAGMGGPPKEQMIQEAYRDILPELEKLGNIRVDSVTIGINSEGESVMAAARGRYNPKALIEWVKAQDPDSKILKVGEIDGVQTVDGHVAILMPSSEQLILVGGPVPAALPIDAVVKAIKMGTIEGQRSEEIKKLLDGVDRSKNLWAVAKVTDEMRMGLGLPRVFETFSLTVESNQAGLTLTLEITGSDAAKFKEATEQLSTQLVSAIKDVKQAMAQEPALKAMMEPAVAMMESIKITSDGTKAKATAQIKGGLSGVIGGLFELPMMMMEAREAPMAAPMPAQGPAAPRPIPALP